LLKGSEGEVTAAFAEIADCNPFLPERIELERRALGDSFVEGGAVWHAEGNEAALSPNLDRLRALAERLSEDLRSRLAKRIEGTSSEIRNYQGLVRYLLFARYEEFWFSLLESESGGAIDESVHSYGSFVQDARHFLHLPGRKLIDDGEIAHLFALGFQVRRAFHQIFRQIFGGSLPAARLRATVWQSIFTHDFPRYRNGLYTRMDDIPTLVTGESGTGKELVARAIALSRYIPFEPRKNRFAVDFSSRINAVNLAALTPTLIESELFGHRRGAFTGAHEDREGWLESCGRYGAVFIDEIGELEESIQVKLLRVLQTRAFQRIGETKSRRFDGKVIAATNRDLSSEIKSGRFREDLYYRLCADQVRTPTLREQLGDRADDLENLIQILARRIVGADEVARLCDEVGQWIRTRMPAEYPWPGNMRELEQCVRNVLIRGEYHPQNIPSRGVDDLAALLATGEATVDELIQRYCRLIYERTGSYQETARRIGLDRRTVKAKIEGRRDEDEKEE
jgi:transcriptional regulator with AAA-type ATPase domain